MYFLDPSKKNNPVLRWNLPDKIFFGYGACHVLAGVYMNRFQNDMRPLWIVPKDNYPGNHIFVTDGCLAFDHHGYSSYTNLIDHYFKGWKRKHIGWDASIVDVDFSLLDSESLNAYGMRSPDQYLHNPIKRAEVFLSRFNHDAVFV